LESLEIPKEGENKTRIYLRIIQQTDG
jgi:hypothetical protein